MAIVLSQLEPALGAPATTWLQQARERVASEGSRAIPELWPQLPRRIGREPLGGGTVQEGEARADLDAWRRCDAAGLVLLSRTDAPDGLEVDLFQHGDLEERTMVMRCLALLPVRDATVTLLGEAQRTNTMTHFEAAVCDSNLLGRALAHADFGQADFNRMVLKLAFTDLPLGRVLDVDEHANADLSEMLQNLATEREAAGRAVWTDTNRLIARAPTEGTLARLIGHLEHGADGHRLAAAEGLAHLNKPELRPFMTERLAREPRAEIRAALERALS